MSKLDTWAYICSRLSNSANRKWVKTQETRLFHLVSKFRGRSMDRRIIAVVIIVLFLSSGLAVVAPAEAHFTLGNLIPNYPFHQNDFDPHVPGVIGYVWPGGG